MSAEWYEKWFSSKYYPELYRHRNEQEAADIVNLIQRTIKPPPTARVLDVCCGSGRHSIEFAKRGYSVTGFDLSRYLISLAKKNLAEAKEKDLKARFYIKDMRSFYFKVPFEICINLFSSFGYFESDKDNFKVFSNVSDCLKDGGYFVFDYLNENFLRENLKELTEDEMNGKKIIQKRRIENNYVIKEITIGNKVFEERIKLYSLPRIKNALKQNGLNTEFVFGDYYGNSFDRKESGRMIVFAKKI